jgi:hypothetical protein
MLLAGHEFHCLQEVLIIASALSVQDPRERPMDQQQAADEQHRRFHDERSDFFSWIKLWNYVFPREAKQQSGGVSERPALASRRQRERQFQREFINPRRLREWADVYQQLEQSLLDLHLNPKPFEGPEDAAFAAVHQALMTGLIGNLKGFAQVIRINTTAPTKPNFLFIQAQPCSAKHRAGSWPLKWLIPPGSMQERSPVLTLLGSSAWVHICLNEAGQIPIGKKGCRSGCLRTSNDLWPDSLCPKASALCPSRTPLGARDIDPRGFSELQIGMPTCPLCSTTDGLCTRLNSLSKKCVGPMCSPIRRCFTHGLINAFHPILQRVNAWSSGGERLREKTRIACVCHERHCCANKSKALKMSDSLRSWRSRGLSLELGLSI